MHQRALHTRIFRRFSDSGIATNIQSYAKQLEGKTVPLVIIEDARSYCVEDVRDDMGYGVVVECSMEMEPEVLAELRGADVIVFECKGYSRRMVPIVVASRFGSASRLILADILDRFQAGGDTQWSTRAMQQAASEIILQCSSIQHGSLKDVNDRASGQNETLPMPSSHKPTPHFRNRA